MFVISCEEEGSILYASVDSLDVFWTEKVSSAIQFNRKIDCENFMDFSDCFDDDCKIKEFE